MKLDEYEDRFEREPIKTAMGTAIKVGLGILAVVIVLGFVGGLVHIISAPAVQATRIMDKTIDADNVIYNYEWFHRQYGDLQAMTPKLTNAEAALADFERDAGPRSTWAFDDKQEHARLASIVLGLKNQRAEIVQTYNAHAGMSNRSIFIGSDMPQHVE